MLKLALKDWKTKPLGELLGVQNGYAFASEQFTKNGGMPLIRIRDLRGGRETEIRFEGEFDEKFVVKSEDLLIGMDGEFRCYKWQGADALLNQRVCRLIDFSDEVLPEFVFYGVNSHLKVIEDNTPFVTVRHLSAKKVKEIYFAYPSLAEQRRIVTRIKECMERVEEIKSLRCQSAAGCDYLLESLIESEFQNVSGNSVVLKDVCKISSKLVSPLENKYLDMLYVGGANIETKTGELINLKTAKEGELKSAKFVFDETVVLYNKIRPYLMKVARPDFRGLCSADMYPLSPNPDRLTRDYLFYLLLSKGFTMYAIEGSNRAGMPKVNRNYLFSFEFPMPSIQDQIHIAKLLDTAFLVLDELRRGMRDTTSEVGALRESILRMAFAGEL